MVFLGELQLQLQHFLLPNHGKIPHGSFAKIRPRVGRQGRAAAGQHRHHQRAGSRRYDLTSSLSLKTVSDMLRWGLRLVVYPIIYRVWDTSTRWLFGISEPSTISFRKGCKNHFSQFLENRVSTEPSRKQTCLQILTIFMCHFM